MKYKCIQAVAHNWTHSFMSGMNYVDGDFIYRDLYRLARERQGQKVTITWIPERPEELVDLTPRVRKSLEYNRQELPGFLARHQIDPAAIVEMRTEVYVAEGDRICVNSYVLDDRGKERVQLVYP